MDLNVELIEMSVENKTIQNDKNIFLIFDISPIVTSFLFSKFKIFFFEIHLNTIDINHEIQVQTNRQKHLNQILIRLTKTISEFFLKPN